LKIQQGLGWAFLVLGVSGYVLPWFYEWLGFRGGLVAFLLIFIGISLLRIRKDQLDK